MNDVTFVHNICLALTTGSLAILTTMIIFKYFLHSKKSDIHGKEVKLATDEFTVLILNPLRFVLWNH